ncbi:MAG: DUF5807 family protein [Halococcoides sp.]
MCDQAGFLAGRCPGHVAIYLADETVTDQGSIESFGERVDGGVILVVEGDRGRSAFETAIGEDPMAFARSAGDRDGTVDRDLTGGTCPEATDADDGTDADAHRAQVIFAFVQEQLDDAEGPYTEGDVLHAYVRCACGVDYSEKWIIE